MTATIQIPDPRTPRRETTERASLTCTDQGPDDCFCGDGCRSENQGLEEVPRNRLSVLEIGAGLGAGGLGAALVARCIGAHADFIISDFDPAAVEVARYLLCPCTDDCVLSPSRLLVADTVATQGEREDKWAKRPGRSGTWAGG
jgi:hypothetical protein